MQFATGIKNGLVVQSRVLLKLYSFDYKTCPGLLKFGELPGGAYFLLQAPYCGLHVLNPTTLLRTDTKYTHPLLQSKAKNHPLNCKNWNAHGVMPTYSAPNKNTLGAHCASKC
jgi:hypothetical protein